MKKKKDILFLCQFFYPEYVSSATLPYDTAVALERAGFSVDVLCGYPKEYNNGINVKKRENASGINIRRVNYFKLKRSNFFGRLINYFSFTAAIFCKFFILRRYKYIVVYSNPPILPLVAYYAKKIWKTRFVFVAYDIYPELALKTGSISENGFISKLMKFINLRVYSEVDCVITLSSEMKMFLEKNRNIIPDNISVIPNWYEDLSDKYKEVSKNNIFAEKYAGKFVVSYLGNMGICQDMDTIIECIRMLKEYHNIQFIFAGHGNKIGYLKKTVANESLENVDIYDFLHGNDYHDALSISDCSIVSLEKGVTGLCSPSKAYGYMMAGNALIAIMDDSDIVSEIRDNCLGCAIKNGESDRMADFILRASLNRNEVNQMKKSSIEVFKKKYTKQNCIAMYVDLFSKLID